MRNQGRDRGLCLLGARTMLKHVKALRKEIKRAKGGADVEAVHRMRVASRRIRSDMPIFEPCYKGKRLKRWRKATKGVTRALGAARDEDVQIEYLRSFLLSAPSEAVPGVAALFGYKQSQRGEIQGPVETSLGELQEAGTLREMRSRLDKRVWRFEGRRADVRTTASYAAALAHVSEHTREILAMESYVHHEEAKAEHHRIRIAAKQLRYTLEAFRPLFDDKLGEEIEVLKGLQDLLGDMHDCVVWTETLPDLLAPAAAAAQLDETAVRPGLDAVAQDRAAAWQEMYRRFVPTWDGLRENGFFERTTERFQLALSEMELGASVADLLHRPAKLALISDVHGNLDALTAVMEDGRREGVAAFLNMGDSVGFGAFSEEVVERLRSERVLSIAGNYDHKVLDLARTPKKAKARAARGEASGVAARDLSEDSLEFIASLPDEVHADLGGRRAVLVHASPLDPDEHLSADTPDSRLEEIAEKANADIVLVGHSHKPLSRTVGGTMFINPGSVGRPADHDPRASYAILDTSDFSVRPRKVEYDVEAAARAIVDRGLPSELADNIRQGSLGPEKQVEDVEKGSKEEVPQETA